MSLFVSHRLTQVRVRPLLLRLIDSIYQMLEVLLGGVETERSLKKLVMESLPLGTEFILF